MFLLPISRYTYEEMKCRFLLVVHNLLGCKGVAAYQHLKDALGFPYWGESSQRTSSLSRCWTMLLPSTNESGGKSIVARGMPDDRK
jgi:hypothetical protein